MAIATSTRTVSEILDRALQGQRITDSDALVLLQSRDLVSIGQAADELRNRKVDPAEVTFIVDRNINYSNVCVDRLRLLRASTAGPATSRRATPSRRA